MFPVGEESRKLVENAAEVNRFIRGNESNVRETKKRNLGFSQTFAERKGRRVTPRD